MLREGALKQLLVNLDAPTPQDDLSAVANRLNDLLEGLTAREAATAIDRLEPADPALDLARRVGERGQLGAQ